VDGKVKNGFLGKERKVRIDNMKLLVATLRCSTQLYESHLRCIP